MAPRRTIVLCAAVLAAMSWGASAADTPDEPSIPAGLAAPTPMLSWSGRPVVALQARSAPSTDADVVSEVSPVGELGGGDLALLVTDVREVDGDPWVEVLLPVRPNGTRGWVRADTLQLSSSPYRVLVDQSERRLTVYRWGRVWLRTRVALGAPETPTPNGEFAVAEKIATGNPTGFIGSWVLPITGYSNVLYTFDGGNGRVALHGTSRPDLLGQFVSHGCVRVRNDAVRRIVRFIGPGVPVTIRP